MHKYYLLNRPPGIGCQPAGAIETVSEFPKKFPPELPRGHFGTVGYEAPLDFKEVWRYELLPLCPVQRAVYMVWQDSQDLFTALDTLREYFELPTEELNKLAGYSPDGSEFDQDNIQDFTAYDVKSMISTGITWEAIQNQYLVTV